MRAQSVFYCRSCRKRIGYGVENAVTRTRCKECASIRDCKALFPKQAGASSSGRFWYREHGEGTRIQFLKRGRECSSCGSIWLTVEIDENIFEKLLEEVKELEIENDRMSAKLETISDVLKAEDD